MGCKCANRNDEEEKEISKNGLENGNLEEDDYNNNFKKNNIDLLGLNDQQNQNQNEEEYEEESAEEAGEYGAAGSMP